MLPCLPFPPPPPPHPECIYEQVAKKPSRLPLLNKVVFFAMFYGFSVFAYAEIAYIGRYATTCMVLGMHRQ
jgi:hypothetical protein